MRRGTSVWPIRISGPASSRSWRWPTGIADVIQRTRDYLSWYVVAGELDGDKMLRNARELDRYFKQYSDLTVVEYLGRGFEPFGDEIQRLFDWMGRRRRNIPKEIECVSMRPWDNFFWWLEVDGLPERSMVLPGNWPPDRTARPTQYQRQAVGNEQD